MRRSLACVALAATALTASTVLAAPTYAAAPALTLNPAAKVDSGTAIKVHGTGFDAKATVGVVQCVNPATPSTCDTTSPVVLTTTSAGSFQTSVSVHTGKTGTGTCVAGGTCFIVAANASKTAQAAVASFTFATSGDVTLSHTVVVSRLNNPRQLDLVANDELLIAEAGRGGTLAKIKDPEGATNGVGFTGSVSLVLNPATASKQRPYRIVTGLLSAAAAKAADGLPAGSQATGSDGVAGRTLDRIAIQETYLPVKVGAAQNGRLIITHPIGSHPAYPNITAFERKHDPDKKGFDSDPYAVVKYGTGWLVADAAGNDLLHVTAAGRISVFHVFPNVTTGSCAKQFDPKKPFKGCNFVPTSIAVGASGHVFVGGLSSLTPGQAQLVELNAHGTRVHTWTGFSAIDGVAVGPDGSIYVSQLFGTEAHPPFPQVQGVVTRVHGTNRQNVDVPFAAGLAVDRAGNVYVSAWSILPAGGAGAPGLDTSGQVWRLHF